MVEENEDGTYGVIDGKQRLTIFSSFYHNEFALHKSLLPIDIEGTTYELAGKKFDKLDEEVKDRFKSREFQLYIMSNATEDDIREIFARINSSKGLSNTQKRTTVENKELAERLSELEHYFMQHCKENDADIAEINKALTLLSERTKPNKIGFKS